MGKPQSTGNLVNALVQDSSNNIGIGGAANASFKLQVTGTTNLTGALTGVASTFLGKLTVGSSSLAEGEIGIFETGGNYNFTTFKNGTVRTIIGSQSSTSQGFLGTASTHDLLIKTNDTTRLTIAASTGAATFKSNGTTNSILLSSPTNAPTFNLISLNGSITEGQYIGFVAGGGSATDLYYQSGNAGAHIFRTGDGSAYTERMRITSGGNIITKAYNAGEAFLLNFNGSSALYGFANYNNGNITVVNSGVANVGFFSMSTGVYTPTSDVNKKKDFEDSTIGLDAILGLKPKLYRMKTEDESIEKTLGFIAQEVKDYIPQAYAENITGDEVFIGLQDRPIIAALVKAVQELKAEIDELKNK